MAFAVDPLTYVVSVPQSDLTFVSGTLYNHDTDAFRLELKSWEDSEEGIHQPKTHDHNTEVVIGGITYARAIEILAPYTIEYEDGQYTVILQGSNNNIWDVAGGILVQNQVQIIPTNSAGLIVVTQGSGVTEQDKLDIADKVWDETAASHVVSGSFGGSVELTRKILKNRQEVINDQLIIYDDNGTSVLLTFNLLNNEGNPTTANAFRRSASI